LGAIPQQVSWRIENPPRSQNMYMFALLAAYFILNIDTLVPNIC